MAADAHRLTRHSSLDELTARIWAINAERMRRSTYARNAETGHVPIFDVEIAA